MKKHVTLLNVHMPWISQTLIKILVLTILVQDLYLKQCLIITVYCSQN
jgi:hypothetical protein